MPRSRSMGVDSKLVSNFNMDPITHFIITALIGFSAALVLWWVTNQTK